MRVSSVVARLVVPAGAMVPAVAWAQATPITPPPSASATAGGAGAGAIAMVAIVLGLLVIVGVAVKLYDLKRKREAESVHLQAQISDALLREQALFGMPVTPTAHVPFWSGGPACIEVTGHVPSTEAREQALRLIQAEAARIRPDFTIEDHLAVVPEAARRAA
ncbi:MAG: hypothetical protein HYU41_11180 [Candidatus Rokubacteria bacterium]|nr:hypothetical protein [Candidatus Rokubacteria bacterium]